MIIHIMREKLIMRILNATIEKKSDIKIQQNSNSINKSWLNKIRYLLVPLWKYFHYFRKNIWNFVLTYFIQIIAL